MGNRAELVRAYIEAIPALPVFVLGIPRFHLAKVSAQPLPNLTIVAELWFSKSSHLDLVRMRARLDFEAIGAMRPEGWIELPHQQVLDTIVNVAAILGAPWFTRESVERAAQAAVDRILVEVEAQRRSGGLATVNAEYKIYRQRQEANGEKAITYGAHLAGFTRSLVLLAAKNAA